LDGSQGLTTVALLNTNVNVILQTIVSIETKKRKHREGKTVRRRFVEERGLTPPELEVFSSPVSAKGSNFWRFWIAELATHKVSHHPTYKM